MSEVTRYWVYDTILDGHTHTDGRATTVVVTYADYADLHAKLAQAEASKAEALMVVESMRTARTALERKYSAVCEERDVALAKVREIVARLTELETALAALPLVEGEITLESQSGALFVVAQDGRVNEVGRFLYDDYAQVYVNLLQLRQRMGKLTGQSGKETV